MIVRLLLVVLLGLNSVQAKIYKRIPAPEISGKPMLVAPGTTVGISGQGFIANYPQANKVRLKLGKKKINLTVLESKANGLILALPEGLDYGDYDLELKLKTALLKSKIRTVAALVKLRPAAPSSPELKYNVVNNAADKDALFDEPKLHANFADELKIGPNPVSFTYTVNGYQSLASESVNIFYFPEEQMQSSLILESTAPLKALAQTKVEDLSFDVSGVTQIKTEDLTKSFFLSTPSYPKYLEYIIQLQPIFIEKLHVTAEEYAVLRNRSAEDFLLMNCTLSDSIRVRHEFTDSDLIPAHKSIKLEANLGLNDSSPDFLQLACGDEEYDKYSYKGLDAEGFGVRDDF